MGLECRCKAAWRGRQGQGRLHLDGDGLIFRGDFRVSLPRAAMRGIAAEAGWLKITTDAESAAFAIGSEAEKWAARLLNPKSRIEKLGVRPGMRVLLLEVADPEFAKELGRAGAAIETGRPRGAYDLIFHGADSEAALARLAALRSHLRPEGALWVVSLKGKSAPVAAAQVRAAAHAQGLVDTKVVAFSTDRTALKLVIPLAKRPQKRRA